MRTSKHIKELQRYINEDKIYQDYKKGIEPSHNDGSSDFEWFCIGHCEDIEWVLNKLKETQKRDFKSYKENLTINLKLTSLIYDLDTILMVMKERPTEKNAKKIIHLIKETKEKLCKQFE